MSLKAAHLQALFARRREAEHNRIERTEAVNKYFDHWGRVTARFENWTAPDYYKQAEQQFAATKQQKEKQKILTERQQKLTKLLDMEKKMYELEMQEKERNRNKRRSLDTQTLEKIDANLKEQQQIRRKLELEAKLYGKWRHGVDDDNMIFESKNNTEVLAKLNWLDRQVNQQLQREKEEEEAKERQLKLQQEINKSEELQKERQKIREKEIHEIRSLQEHHLEQLKERQKETDSLKAQEKKLKENLSDLNKENELLEESYAVLNKAADFNEANNFKKIKLFIRKRSEKFRNHIHICLSIVDRTLDFAEKPENLKQFKQHLEQELEKETFKVAQIDGMYESETKYSLQFMEQLWQEELLKRYNELKKILMEEYHLINTKLNELMKKHEELIEMRGTHLSVIENSSEKLKQLIQEEENSPRYQKGEQIVSPDVATKEEKVPKDLNSIRNIIHNQFEESADTPLYSPRLGKRGKTGLTQVDSKEKILPVEFSTRRNCNESLENNMSPSSTDLNRITSSFNNLNLDAWQANDSRSTPRDMESQKMNSQRSMQVVTPETEAERPRFGRKRVAWN